MSILLITFNRPDHVRKVLDEIRKQKPAQLFVCQDGPRDWKDGYDKAILKNGRIVRADDLNKVLAVRQVIDELVDWDCELHTLYQDENLGCGAGPMTGIDWFFRNVEMGIVMEDDCFPHPDAVRKSRAHEKFNNEHTLFHPPTRRAAAARRRRAGL